mmetsp:Transcript_30199/g.78287  ORF Transcript_30199/g.78287 Transcript_30199/m.78287 type:complete len:103 (-) Transcript_30199:86-394(-)
MGRGGGAPDGVAHRHAHLDGVAENGACVGCGPWMKAVGEAWSGAALDLDSFSRARGMGAGHGASSGQAHMQDACVLCLGCARGVGGLTRQSAERKISEQRVD